MITARILLLLMLGACFFGCDRRPKFEAAANIQESSDILLCRVDTNTLEYEVLEIFKLTGSALAGTQIGSKLKLTGMVKEAAEKEPVILVLIGSEAAQSPSGPFIPRLELPVRSDAIATYNLSLEQFRRLCQDLGKNSAP